MSLYQRHRLGCTRVRHWIERGRIQPPEKYHSGNQESACEVVQRPAESTAGLSAWKHRDDHFRGDDSSCSNGHAIPAQILSREQSETDPRTDHAVIGVAVQAVIARLNPVH